MRTLVVGANSFIARHLTKFVKVSYYDFKNVDLTKYDVVINCAINPLYKIENYQESIDIDFEIGQKVCEHGLHFIMLSTSKIYGDCDDLKCYNEFSTPKPYDNHSTNKLITENKLLTNFPRQITILRGSNIFGFEYGRNSFMGYCMSQLVNEGKITLTFSEDSKRDFLPIENAVKIIESVCDIRPLGVYNLSSNYPLKVITVIQSLIDGYGYNSYIDQTGFKLDRQFVLDNTKLKETLNIYIGPFDYKKIFYYLGKQLYEQRN
jgi:nucleoside-diphosphate-sugar epimerase